MRPPETIGPGAAEPQGGARAAGPGRCLVFVLERQEYALPLSAVVEVTGYRRPTPVPGADEAVEGITPLRGAMVTVINTRRRLGLAAGPGGDGDKLIVVREADELVALVVDAVVRVAPVVGGECGPVPAALGLPPSAAHRGAVSREGRCLLLLDPAALVGGEDDPGPAAPERP